MEEAEVQPNARSALGWLVREFKEQATLPKVGKSD